MRGQPGDRHTQDATTSNMWYLYRYKVLALFKKVTFIEVIVGVSLIEAK